MVTQESSEKQLKILYQNENKISLDVTGIQVVFRIETALKYL